MSHPEIQSNQEVMHYGVLGMKWGVRNDKGSGVARAQAKVDSINSKRKQIQETRGVANSEYIKTSKNLLYAKGQLDVAKGKASNDAVLKILGKEKQKEATILKKPESASMIGFAYKKNLYPSNLTSQERAAINAIEQNRSSKYYKSQKIKTPLKVAGSIVGITIGVNVVKNIIQNQGTSQLSGFANKGNAVMLGKQALASMADTFFGFPISQFLK
jgi:hypothetical protein